MKVEIERPQTEADNIYTGKPIEWPRGLYQINGDGAYKVLVTDGGSVFFADGHDPEVLRPAEVVGGDYRRMPDGSSVKVTV